jgi:acetolactate synthase-1/2/3 large subunit
VKRFFNNSCQIISVFYQKIMLNTRTSNTNSIYIDRAVALITQAKKPIIYSGGGSVIGNASEILRSFTRHTNFPITQTLMGLGAYPATDSQSLGMLGMHGTYEANMAMHDSDCIIAVGARFDDRITGNLDKFCQTSVTSHWHCQSHYRRLSR